MKNFFRTVGNLTRARSAKVPLVIIAIAAIIGFVMIGCAEEEEETSFGNELKLSGQVYTVEEDEETWTVTYTKYTGDLTLKGDLGTGEIKGGKLSFTAGVPGASLLESINSVLEYFEYGYTDPKIVTGTDAKVFSLSIGVQGNNDYYGVYKRDMTVKSSGTSGSFTEESVQYIYVDKPVKITAKGKTTEDDDEKFTTKDIDLSLKEGWNTIYNKESGTFSEDEASFTVSISVSNPELKWVLYD